MKDFKKDYYKILGVHPLASIDEVKLAYRKQAKIYHPDLNPDNPEYEALIKEINEAYEVLGNKDERYAYDQYLLNKKAHQQEQSASQNPVNKHKRTYTKTTTKTREEKTYLKGKIFIKYRGKHDERDAENILRETFYKIKITQTDAIVEQMLRQHLSEEFKKVFAKHKPLGLNIKQPVSCQILDQHHIPRDYKLHLIDLTIPDPEITNVTKHENESFGTITGNFYCHVKEIKSYKEEVIVEECFGETGETEQKIENGTNYFRKAYYNTDCSKFWGNWVAEVTRPAYRATGKKQTSGNYVRHATTNSDSKKTEWSKWKYEPRVAPQNNGCLGSVGNILGIGAIIFFVIFFIPKLAFLLPLILIPYLLNLMPFRFWTWIFRIAFVLFGVIFSMAIISTILKSVNKRAGQTVVKPKPVIEKPKYTPVVNPQSADKIVDTLINHHMIWEDYSGKTYEGNFSVKKSDLNQAHFYKQNLDISGNSENSYDKIIFSLKENDKNKLSSLYSMFDSIRTEHKLSSMSFAEIVVSFVQTIPYTLVLPEDCDAQYYQDEFTTKYLSSPDARCDGFEKYGINTPIEFLANLNGDCDTRTLLLYTIFSHYNYDVALLSSSHYSHSILGINLPYDGVAYNYNNQQYVFWETTVQNVKPGVLSDEISNTDYWRISLKSN
ncbi:J domain-containing protein [Pedobacter sp. Leaf176]|uniref:J domain-containing protein n=1 Tax=Pedobacter sp. Leaf176 TaxID=1736286 RepID=UPI0006FEF822|nr:DnaJ domain-containing protein [Pedobacter sp. Leaf176]KQR72328.1 hypothetical protein ASF92_03285 [Pedobacter sp. Leaf176]